MFLFFLITIMAIKGPIKKKYNKLKFSAYKALQHKTEKNSFKIIDKKNCEYEEPFEVEIIETNNNKIDSGKKLYWNKTNKLIES